MITIDGSFGEGGGQILRTSLSLSAITGMSVHFENIRANRPKPGLMRQHLACAKAVAEICGGELEGAELNSQQLTLRPGRIQAGDYRFTIGSAGNTLLLAQTILPVLLHADAPSTIVLEGGTYTTEAPVYDFFAHAFLPCLRKMGLEVDTTMEKAGFYPVGGGRVVLSVKPPETWRPLVLQERGALRNAWVTAMGCSLRDGILSDELTIFQSLVDGLESFHAKERVVEADGSGNVLLAGLDYENLSELFSVCGSFSVSRKVVAKRTAGYVRQYLERGWVVGQFLADQLMLPMALGAGGCYVTGKPTKHSLTNREVIGSFLNAKVKFNQISTELYEFEVKK